MRQFYRLLLLILQIFSNFESLQFYLNQVFADTDDVNMKSRSLIITWMIWSPFSGTTYDMSKKYTEPWDLTVIPVSKSVSESQERD